MSEKKEGSQLPEVTVNIPMPKVKPPKKRITQDELRSRVAQFLEDADIYWDKFAEERNLMHENDVITAIVIDATKLHAILDEYVKQQC